MTSLTCRELIEFLSDYLAGDLPAESRAVFEHHLSLCPDCVNYLENFRAAVQSAKAACSDPGLQHVPEGLVQAILKSREAK